MGQREQMSYVRERFDGMGGLRAWIDGIEGDVADETGFDLGEDALSWAGPELSMAILDADDAEIDAAGTIDVRDRDAAADFLADWLDHLEDERTADFDRESIGGYDAWTDDDGRQAYALAGDLLVFATTESGLKGVLGRIAGERAPTLADDGQFMEARAALPERRFASAYVDYDRLTDLALAASREADPPFGGVIRRFGLDTLLPGSAGPCGSALFETPDWAAASAAWVERGVIAEFVAPVVGATSQQPDAPDAAGLLPEDALGFVSVSFDPDADRWREALRECAVADLVPDWETVFPWVNAALPGLIESTGTSARSPADGAPELAGDSTLADALDLGLWAADHLVGVHPEEYLLDHLDGAFIAAAYDVDFTGAAPHERPASTFDGVVMLSYRPDREDALAAALHDLASGLAFLTGPAEQTDVGAARDAWVLGSEEGQFRLGYVLHDGYLTIGTGAEPLRTAVARQRGASGGLAASREYRSAIGHLPNGIQSLAYVDLQRIDGVHPDVLGMSDGAYAALADGLSAAAMSSGAEGKHRRATFVLTLLPEE